MEERGTSSVSHSISVIIPTSRGGPYLVAAVASVRAQTAPVDEVILVDDGAPGTALQDLARELGLRYLRLEGVGVSAARNAGAEVATGRWLIFLDDDDVWHPERIAEQLAAIEAHPGAIASHTGGWYMDAEGVRFGQDWPARPATALQMLSGVVPLPRITTLIVRHSVFDDIGGFDVTMRMAEDNDLMRRLLVRGEFAPVDRSLVGYRRHPGNVTSRMLDGRIAARRSIRRLRRAAAEEQDRERADALDQRWRRFLREGADENLRELWAALRGRDWRYAVRCAAWAARTAPWQTAAAALRKARTR